MKKWNWLVVATLALSSCCCPPVSEEEFAKDGYVRLFNGKDHNGWSLES